MLCYAGSQAGSQRVFSSADCDFQLLAVEWRTCKAAKGLRLLSWSWPNCETSRTHQMSTLAQQPPIPRPDAPTVPFQPTATPLTPEPETEIFTSTSDTVPGGAGTCHINSTPVAYHTITKKRTKNTLLFPASDARTSSRRGLGPAPRLYGSLLVRVGTVLFD